MKELMIMYHPVKKEVRFLANAKGEFVEIPLEMCPRLRKYSPENGEFLLQNQGNQFFADLEEQFPQDKIELTFKGTKVDYEDFKEKLAKYKKSVKGVRVAVKKFIELPSVEEIFAQINDFCEETITLFDSELKDSDIREVFQQRREEFENKSKKLNTNDINLCFVGAYSAGKSTFINALIGKRILPESINSETAKMFRIQNDTTPSVLFTIKNKDNDEGIEFAITWNAKKDKFEYAVSRECKYVAELIDQQIGNAMVFHLQQHEQVYQILKCLNDIPNVPTEECSEYIDGIIEVHFPIMLDPNLSFTFYDTPGTDSNSDEHLLVLRKALQQQTNSILIIMYEPTKMEGTANSLLYKIIKSSRESEETRDKVYIDLSRSLHIINQADTRSIADLSTLRDSKVEVSLREADKIHNEKDEYIDLSDQRLFFVSAKAAYISKAIKNNIDTEDDRLWLANHRNEINNDHVSDPLLMMDKGTETNTGMYFKLNNMAYATNETEQMMEECMKELESCEKSDDKTINSILRRIYINSGMYAIEREIVKYGHKYALAVKAKGLYDGISSVVKFIKDDYEAIEAQARLSKQQISDNINTMKTTMVRDIENSYSNYMQTLNTGDAAGKIKGVEQISSFVESSKILAEKVANKMSWIALKPEVFEEKNNVICSELNSLLLEIDACYKESREMILKNQIETLRNTFMEKIAGYKGIDEELVQRIANVSDTQVPPSTLKAPRMDEYIKKQKVIFIFSTNDKNAYKNDICKVFEATAQMQYESYVSEIIEVAKLKATELINEFKGNIDIMSSKLELLMNDEKEAMSKQARAKAVLELVEKRDQELNRKIWGDS